MSRRTWNPLAMFASPGLLFAAFKFVTTNIGTDPATSTIEGGGGLKGADAAGGVANSGPSFIESITKTANDGEYLVTLADGYRSCWFSDATMWAPAAGPAGGDDAQVSVPANQGSGHTTKVTVLVTTIDVDGVPVETTGRTVCVFMVLKDSGVGS